MKMVVGFIVRRRRAKTTRPVGKLVVEWANGAGGWTTERRRAFLFTTTAGHTHDDPRGNLGGRAWARGHLKYLLERARHEADGRPWRFGIVKVVASA